MDFSAVLQNLLYPVVIMVVGYFLGRGKQDSEIASLLTNSAKGLIEPLNQRLGEQDERIAKQDKQIKALTNGRRRDAVEKRRMEKRFNSLLKKYSAVIHGMGMLVAQIEAAGLKPVYRPPAEGNNVSGY